MRSDSGSALPVAATSKVCHPNLARLEDAEGREVLLIGSLPLDLDGASGRLVSGALQALKPDVVMVEGTWAAGVNAMFLAGRWELHGMPPLPASGANWTDTEEVAPVDIPQPKRKGIFRAYQGPMPNLPERSIVPVKVGRWAHHLRTSVGGEFVAALTSAANSGVHVVFLGPEDGGFQGHMQVTMLAQQAARELLEEESQNGELAVVDVDAALKRAEARILAEARRWLRDGRGETARLRSGISERAPPEVVKTIEKRIAERIGGAAERIHSNMREYRRAAVIISVDELVDVEAKLLEAGYTYVSDCA